MISYSKYPFLRLLIAFIAGIVLNEFLPATISIYLLFLLIIPVFLFSVLAPKKIRLHHKKTVYLGLSLQLFFFVLGFGDAHFHSRKVKVVDLENADGVICRITQTPVAKTRSYKSEAYVQSALIGGNWIDIRKKMIIYTPLSDQAFWKYDDIVFLRSNIARPKSPANPHQFNYKKYLEKKEIFYQTYVKQEDFRIVGEDHHFTLDDFAEASVQYTRHVFHSMIPDENLSSIATALLVGYQEELDPETKTSFSRVGAMHILAVSGLHVGIIFLLLSKILFPLDRNKYTRVLKAFILIAFLWGYALIAGFSPSIVRASLMFTLLIPIISFQVQGNAYNNISSSAFLLLFWQPAYLFDVGFQLSYIAVFGIIYLYPYMRKWFDSKYWLLNQIWQLTAVSLAATFFTTPIVLYYFGQFPLSFLISNLIAVPLSTLIIYVGIAALIFFKVPGLSMLLGKLLYGLLWVLDISIDWIETLPYSYLDHLLINRWQAVLIYLLLFSTVFYFQYRKVLYVRVGLIILCLFTITLIYRRFEILQHREIYVYNLNKTSYIEYVSGHEAINVLNKPLTDLDFGLFIRTNHQHQGIFHRVDQHEDVELNLPGFQIRETRFFFIEGFIPRSENILTTDYLVLSNLKYLDTDLLKEQFRFKKVILLNNHPVKKIKKFKELLAEENIDFYSIADEGYFSSRFR